MYMSHMDGNPKKFGGFYLYDGDIWNWFGAIYIVPLIAFNCPDVLIILGECEEEFCLKSKSGLTWKANMMCNKF